MSTPLLIQFLLCPVVLLALLFVPAPYGRHHSKGWGFTLPNRVAWIAMEFPALLVISWLVLSSPARGAPVTLVPLAFWLFHYGYRTFVFPPLMRPSAQTFPALLVLFAIAFNVLNGYNNAQALVENGEHAIPLISANFLVGAAIFLAGFIIHVQSDAIIRGLRSGGESGYAVPRGGLFRWVGSPNYLGEMIQWTGWAIMTWSLAGLAFALFTMCNLLPRAISNHRWYVANFADYPQTRKILIPWVF
jgi:3-oxo-5-alpha-steroid 4-dehydrogenase 1